MMCKFVLKEDKIRDLKHEKHGVRFTSFAIKALQKHIQQAKKKEIINKLICRRQTIQNSAQKLAKKVAKYVKHSVFFELTYRDLHHILIANNG